MLLNAQRFIYISLPTSPERKKIVLKRKSHHTNCTFGFCHRSKPKHKKPKEQFLAHAQTKIVAKNVTLTFKQKIGE